MVAVRTLARVHRRPLLLLLLLAGLTPRCGSGCEVLPPDGDGAPPELQAGALASHLTPAGLLARGAGLVRALAALPADRLTVAVDGAEGPLTENTRFRYTAGTLQAELHDGGFAVSVEDGTVNATVAFLPLEINVIAEGRLVNLGAAHGHPASVMDMSFATQALTTEYAIKHEKKLGVHVHDVPEKLEQYIAKLKLKTLGTKIDRLTPDQKRYLESWTMGT